VHPVRYRFVKGFTFIEILVTVAIVSTAIIFLLRSFTASLGAARFSQHITLACYLSEARLLDIERAFSDGAAYPASGTETLQNERFNWNYRIRETDNPNLKELQFSVGWQENLREKEYVMDFMTYLKKQ